MVGLYGALFSVVQALILYRFVRYLDLIFSLEEAGQCFGVYVLLGGGTNVHAGVIHHFSKSRKD